MRTAALVRRLQSRTAELVWRLLSLIRIARFSLLTGGILLLALLLRLVGLTWGFPHSFNVDESHVVYLASQLAQRFAQTGSLDPQASSYGALPLYLLALSTALADGALTWLKTLVALPFDSAPMLYVGRLLAVAASTATVGLTMALASALGHEGTALMPRQQRAALWSGLLLAISLLPVREAHFGTVDSLLVLLMMLALLAAARVARTGAWRDYVLTGAAVALAMSVKIGAGLLVVPVLVAHLAHIRGSRGTRAVPSCPYMMYMMLCGLVVVVLWLALNPYALLDPTAYFDLDRNDSVRTQSLVVAGSLRVLYTAQFEGTTPYLYAVTNWLRYGLGLPLTGLSLAGVGYSFWRLWQARREIFSAGAASESAALSSGGSQVPPDPQVWGNWFADAFLLAWLLAYFVVAGGAYAKFIRYALPLIPPLCILAGRLLADLWDGPRRWRLGLRLVVLLIVAAGLLHTLVFVQIYRQPDVRLQAADWIRKQIPAGASILVEKDEGLLLHRAAAEYGLEGYEWRIWNPYEVAGVSSVRYQAPEVSAEQTETYLQNLLTTDYVIVGSSWAERFTAAAAQFPAQADFYRRLSAGQAGYRVLKTFEVTPRLGPFTWDDRGAELTFRLFDHPAITIFVAAAEMPAEK
ncbi:MAG: glycosyltransferase family 39 protein [Anaerolineae bacterium]